MKRSICLTGDLPENWAEAITELSDDLGMVADDCGIPVKVRQGEELAVISDGERVMLTWSEPVQFYRALSLIPEPLAVCEIHEKPCFETTGIMFDCSRNGVLKPEALRFFLRKMALMGLNLGMMYTEDTYEVPEQPWFGYKRGRYTYDELKALDDYASLFGIELCPCIQTLGHLNRALHWPAMGHLRENDEVVLADEAETYVFLEQLIRAASAPYRSKRIHIGMDEAYGVGFGQHYRRFGYEDPHDVMGRHLRRVLEITRKYGLEPMMWSDMFFHLDGQNYTGKKMPSQKAKDAVSPDVTLVLWDYYHDDEEVYAYRLKQHAEFPAPTVFAGAIWTFCGFAPDYPTTLSVTIPALNACKKAEVPMVIAAAWGDNGAETNMLSALLGMQLYGEYANTGRYDENWFHTRFLRCCGVDAQAFLALSRFNKVPGLVSRRGNPMNVCKIMLYQDPLIQLFEEDMAGLSLASHYGELEVQFSDYEERYPEYGILFGFYKALARALKLKCRWHELAAKAVRSGDQETAKALASGVPELVDALERLRKEWRRLWDSTNKPYGFEIIDSRLGGIRARMDTAGEKMREFAEGKIDDIPELSSAALPYMRREDGSMGCVFTMGEIVSACKIDG